MIVGYAIPAVQKFQGAAYKSLYYQALENSKADGATPDDNPCLIARGDELYRAGAGAVPSVLIVPQFVKPGAVYTQIPTPTVEAGDFDQFTFTRATTATRVNASGLIESVASGVLRLDYPVTGGCPAALIEPSAQNLIKQSEAFNTAEWTGIGLNAFGSGSVANSTGTTDPFGGTNADYIQENSASGTHVTLQINAGQVSGTNLTFSVFAKAAERTQINLFNNGGGGGNATFNLTSGTATLVAGVSASIQNYGNGWYRCILTYTPNATGNFNVQVRLVDASGNTSYTGTGASGLYVFGAQVETGAIPTSYIPTTTGSATRNADVCSVSGVSGYIGQTEGTLYAEVDFRNIGYNGVVITLQTDNWITNSIQIQKSLGNQWRITIRAASVAILNVDIGTITAGIYKFALGYNASASGTVLAVNGSILTTQTASSIPACNSVVLGSRNETGTFSTHLNDRLRAAAIYPTRLTNEQLESLTRLT
jgi:hypothetical protein